MPIGLGVFTNTAKSFDLAIKKTKIITNAKALAIAWRRGRFVSPALLAIAGPLPTIALKINRKKDQFLKIKL